MMCVPRRGTGETGGGGRRSLGPGARCCILVWETEERPGPTAYKEWSLETRIGKKALPGAHPFTSAH